MSTNPCFSKIDVVLYFYGPGQFLDLSGRIGHKVNVGEYIQSQVTVTDINLLERDKKDDEEDPTFSKKRKTCSMELYDDCIYNKLTKLMRDNTEDNCTVPYVPGDSKICTKPNDINTTFWIEFNRGRNQEQDCNMPCRSTTVNLGAKNYKYKMGTSYQNKYAIMTLYYAPRFTQSTERHLYTSLNLFAEIGGYVGLILGYSLFHVASLIKCEIVSKAILNYGRRKLNTD